MSQGAPKRPPAKPEAAACGIGFLTSRKGVAERAVVDIALGLCRQFDHRGAPGHGAGLLLDVPWPLLLDRFPEHTRAIAQRDVSLGMFFLPFDTAQRRLCVDTVEELAALAGADVLGWADVPFNVEALPQGSSARRTAPVVRQALFRRPPGMGEDGWFASRYLLRLALDETLSEGVGDDFAISSLSNRTVVYRGLAELSRVAELYPDLRDEHFASRFVLFHSRYSTNTTTAWRRAQPKNPFSAETSRASDGAASPSLRRSARKARRSDALRLASRPPVTSPPRWVDKKSSKRSSVRP